MSQQTTDFLVDAIRRAVVVTSEDTDKSQAKLEAIAKLIDDNTDAIHPHRNERDADYDYAIQEFLTELTAPLATKPKVVGAWLIAPNQVGGMAGAFTFHNSSAQIGALKAVAVFAG